MTTDLELVIDDDPPGPCRHCARIVRWVDGRWLDTDDHDECHPGLAHLALPDDDVIWVALHLEV